VMAGPGATTEEHARALSTFEREAGRDGVPADEVGDILAALADEGFIMQHADGWFVG